MSNNLKLKWLVFSRRNYAFYLTLLLLCISSCLILTVNFLTYLHQIKLVQARGNVYGYFHSIVYQSPADYQPELANDLGVIQALPLNLANLKDLANSANTNSLTNPTSAASLNHKGTQAAYKIIQKTQKAQKSRELFVGTLNEAAKPYVYRSSLADFWPEQTATCAISEQLAKELRLQIGDLLDLTSLISNSSSESLASSPASVPDTISASVSASVSTSNYKLTIKSIIPDLGFLWVHGEKELLNKFFVPNVWVNNATFKQLLNSQNATTNSQMPNSNSNSNEVEISEKPYQLILLNAQQAALAQEFNIQGNIYENTAMTKDYNLFIYRFGANFYWFQFIILAALIIVLLLSYNYHAQARYQIYVSLGCYESQLVAIIRFENWVLSLVPALAALILSYYLASIYVYFVFTDITLISWSRLSPVYSKYLIVYGSSVLVCSAFLQLKLKLKQGRFQLTIFKIFKQINNLFITLAKTKLPLKGSLILACSIPLLCLLTALTFNIFGNIYKTVANPYVGLEHYGQLSQVYDYELNLTPQALPAFHYLKGNELVKSDNTDSRLKFAFNYNARRLDNLATELMSSAEFGNEIQNVELFYENHGAYLQVPLALTKQTLLQKIHVDSVFTPEPGVFQKHFLSGLNQVDAALVNCTILALPAKYLQEIGTKMQATPTQIQGVMAGEMGFLLAPAVKLIKEDQHGGVYWQIAADGEIKDPNLEKYQNVNLYIPQAKTTLAGLIPQNDLLQNQATLKAYPLPIAKSSYLNLGWFSTLEYNSTPYRVIVSSKYLDKHNLLYDATRLRIFLKAAQSNPNLVSYLQDFCSLNQNFVLTDQFYNLSNYSQYRQLLRLSIGLYLSLIVVLLLCFAWAIANSFYLLNIKRLYLLRDIGASLRQLRFNCWHKVLVYLLLGLVIELGLSFIVSWLDIGTWSYLSLWQQLSILLLINLGYLLVNLTTLEVYLRRMLRSHLYSA